MRLALIFTVGLHRLNQKKEKKNKALEFFMTDDILRELMDEASNPQ